jgi:hypothetical protein
MEVMRSTLLLEANYLVENVSRLKREPYILDEYELK